MDTQMEESKTLEAEGQVLSSDEEEIRKEEEEEKQESKITFTEEVKQPLRAVIISECAHSEALTKIIFADDLVEIGKAETTYKGKTKDTLKIHLVKGSGLLVVHKLGSKHSADLSF